MEDWRLPWTSKCLTCVICPKNFIGPGCVAHYVTCFYRFAEGLKTLGLLEELRKNPAVFYNMFVSEEIPLQAKDRENPTICFWRDWLIEIEGIEHIEFIRIISGYFVVLVGRKINAENAIVEMTL
jgi:hypothetical protein